MYSRLNPDFAVLDALVPVVQRFDHPSVGRIVHARIICTAEQLPTMGNSLFARAHEELKKGGLINLMSKIINYIYIHYFRKCLITDTKIIQYNGVESPVETSPLDSIVPGYSPPEGSPGYEDAEIRAIRNYCEEGDKVVIIGAGYGITSVVAAEQSGENGRIIGYEASADMIPRIEQTIQHNDVDDQVEIENAIIAKAEATRGTRGNTDSVPTISPGKLPDCDFLEIDCEGAEEMILREMAIKPRVISVETHKPYGVSHVDITELLQKKRYSIAEKVEKDTKIDGIHHIIAILDDEEESG